MKGNQDRTFVELKYGRPQDNLDSKEAWLKNLPKAAFTAAYHELHSKGIIATPGFDHSQMCILATLFLGKDDITDIFYKHLIEHKE